MKNTRVFHMPFTSVCMPVGSLTALRMRERAITKLLQQACVLSLVIASTGCSQVQPPDSSSTKNDDQWWTYLADYEGSPGSTIVDMSIRTSAPKPEYPKLVITGVSYPSMPNDRGLPSGVQLDSLNNISDEGLALITQRCKAILVGSFAHENERLDYIYVSDTTGLEEALRTFYSTECPTRKPYIHVKDDPQWQAYLDFLYPNAQTLEFYQKK